MLLKDNVAIVYGGGGVIGGVVARAFAAQGANVYLAGRTQEKLEKVVHDIVAAGGHAQAQLVDALDERAVQQHTDAIAESTGRIDIVLNAIGVTHVQGTPLLDLALEDYWYPVMTYARSNFITAKAVARQMLRQRSGVIMMLATPASKMPGPGFLGHSVACAGVEALTRHLAGELGGAGIRTICLRSHAIPEAVSKGSHSHEVFGQVAARAGITVNEMLAGAASSTLLKRLPGLDEVASTAAFMASAHAGAITGAIVNMSCGMLLD